MYLHYLSMLVPNGSVLIVNKRFMCWSHVRWLKKVITSCLFVLSPFSCQGPGCCQKNTFRNCQGYWLEVLQWVHSPAAEQRGFRGSGVRCDCLWWSPLCCIKSAVDWLSGFERHSDRWHPSVSHHQKQHLVIRRLWNQLHWDCHCWNQRQWVLHL